ncbi:amastin-like surface protein-like protein-related [Anaeramoeba ignava]|uniref:Amastin-like surface protein-like protein-related n=1 Tax=Anaeramoeba ignava TaxID=1746090 RepID=A0A9Q0LN80_ANAIG|nr:amastin-like surface protein-like protein-related [Anaeramoeba ignava]
MSKVWFLRILVLVFLFLCAIFSAISIGSYSILKAKESYGSSSSATYFGNFLGYTTETGESDQDIVTICGAKEDDDTLYRGFITNALFGFIAFMFFMNAFAFILHKPKLSFVLAIIATCFIFLAFVVIAGSWRESKTYDEIKKGAPSYVKLELGYGVGFALEVLAFFFGIFSILGSLLISRWTKKI